MALRGERPAIDSITGVWPCADWYEREVWDMFGVDVRGHPHLARLLSPPWWEGHPLRKEAPSRGTELGPFEMPREVFDSWQDDLRFKPEEWGLPRPEDDPTLMYLNVGPQHGATHGPLRIVVGLRDEEIVHCVPDIGFHHRGAEKMSERQTWHTFIPYTDRIDYLGGVMNDLPWVLTVEKLCGIEVPDRAQVIRVMLCEFFRIASHLVFYGTFAQDIGALSPVFYMFEDRERLFDAVVSPICGARMHPNWFRIGGVAEDLPDGLGAAGARLPRLPAAAAGRVRPAGDGQPHHEGAHRRRGRHLGQGRGRVGRHRTQPARRRPAVGLAQAAALQSLRLVRLRRPRRDRPGTATTGPPSASRRCGRACASSASASTRCPAARTRPTTPRPPRPPRSRTRCTTSRRLITHFLGVSWGPVVPPGEACVYTEGSKGQYSYYAISDGGTSAYRTKIRTPSFPHLQVLPLLARGFEIADLVTILGSLDFVMGDVDR